MLTLRPATPADGAFLFRLYLETQGADLAGAALPDAQKQALLASQFRAREQHYRERFPDARCDIVELHGQPIGRHYVSHSDGEALIIDIGLLAAHRGQGIGTALLQQLLAEATERGSSVALRVQRENPALRLYQRLGFAAVDEDELLVTMIWLPGARVLDQEVAHGEAA